ncbi:MAG: hypothetical protein LBB45_07130 [Methanobrevibacter sp.]|jgi:hypothetical protein|nr:hypothetical protein [Candidatus Methanovirga basalitermitum]
MKLSTLSDHGRKLKEMSIKLKEMERYISENPEKGGVKGNYETLKYVYEEVQKRRDLLSNKLKF